MQQLVGFLQALLLGMELALVSSWMKKTVKVRLQGLPVWVLRMV